MKGSLNLGKVSGIKIEMHWTFLLLIVWVAYLKLKEGAGTQEVMMNILFVIILFICVVLHELGHALTAKRFGVKTKNIMLLPIGGVASLEKIPEDPKQELLIAIAGPLVNIAIAFILLLFLPLNSFISQDPESLMKNLENITFQNFAFFLFTANIVLAIFNMIPAFPMDGGRVLRAFLAIKLGRVRATQIASFLGQWLAVIFFFLGFSLNPFLIIIGLFVYVGAVGENKMVQQLALLKGHKVKEALLTKITILKVDDSIEEAINSLISGSEKHFIVIDNEKTAGILSYTTIIKNLKKENIKIEDIMRKQFKTVTPDTDIKNIFELVNLNKQTFFPVEENGNLVGAIDLDNINEYITLQAALQY